VFSHRAKIKRIGLLFGVVAVLLTVGFFIWPVITESIRHRVAVQRFDNTSREYMVDDFEYLMTVLEENWPFFNLSVSANNVDVRELADDVRVLLNDPSTAISSPLDFLDLMQEYFFMPIGQLGHLRPTLRYEHFFSDKQLQQEWMSAGANIRWGAYLYPKFPAIFLPTR